MTTFKLERDLAGKLERTARAAGVAPEVLAIATLERSLNVDSDRRSVRDAPRRSRGRTKLRDLRLPSHVRERADELIRRDQTAPSPVTRARVLNGALRRGLPEDPRIALAVVIVAATPRAPRLDNTYAW